MTSRRKFLGLLAGSTVATSLPVAADESTLDSPFLKEQVATGQLPKLSRRLPKNPRIVDVQGMGREPGQHGGTVRILIGRQKDIRYVPINSYSRLVGYDQQLQLQPDILKSFTVEEGRIFTFELRDGHRWSDGSASVSYTHLTLPTIYSV